MKRGFKLSSASTALALLVAVITTLIAGSANASAALAVHNNTRCAVFICATTTGGATVCATVPANTHAKINVTCPLPVVSITVCSTTLAVPPGGCLTNLLLPGGCCADVCFDNGPACVLTINPVAGPCTC